MYFVHDLHALMGEREFEFEDLVRDEYAPALDKDDDARLLWYFHHTHGSGNAYHVVTITAVRDGDAWERLTDRLRRGDLAEWSARVEALRYGSTSTLLVQASWSPLGTPDLAGTPSTAPDEQPSVVHREDVLTGPGIARTLAAAAAARARTSGDVLEPVAAFVPAFVATDDEVRVLYRVGPTEQWATAFGTDVGWGDWPGSLTPTLPDNAHSAARMLRTAPWSPLR